MQELREALRAIRAVRSSLRLSLRAVSQADALAALLGECRSLLHEAALGTSQLLALPSEIVEQVLSCCDPDALAHLACSCTHLSGMCSSPKALAQVALRRFSADSASDRFANELTVPRRSAALLATLDSAKLVARTWSETGGVRAKHGKLKVWPPDATSVGSPRWLRTSQIAAGLSIQEGVSLLQVMTRAMTYHDWEIPGVVLGSADRTPRAHRTAFMVMALLELCTLSDDPGVSRLALDYMTQSKSKTLQLWAQGEVEITTDLGLICLFDHPLVCMDAIEAASNKLDEGVYKVLSNTARAPFFAQQLAGSLRCAQVREDSDYVGCVLNMWTMEEEKGFELLRAGAMEALLDLSESESELMKNWIRTELNPNGAGVSGSEYTSRLSCDVVLRMFILFDGGNVQPETKPDLARWLMLLVRAMWAYPSIPDGTVEEQSPCVMFAAIEALEELARHALWEVRSKPRLKPPLGAAQEAFEVGLLEAGSCLLATIPRLAYDEGYFSSPGIGLRQAVSCIAYMAPSPAFRAAHGAAATTAIVRVLLEVVPGPCVDLHAVGLRALLILAAHDTYTVLRAGARALALHSNGTPSCRPHTASTPRTAQADSMWQRLLWSR